MPRPVVWLEDGVERVGRGRLAWGARERFRLEWREDRIGDLDWISQLPLGDGRAYGVVSYDLGLPPHATRKKPPVEQPLAEFFVPQRELVVDLETGDVVEGQLRWIGELADRRRGGQADRWTGGSAILLDRSFSRAAFEAAVRRIKEHIAAGDVYQVNLALAERFAVEYAAWEVYRRLREVNPSPWMGFADFGDWQLVSGSPELLVEVRNEKGRPPPTSPTAREEREGREGREKGQSVLRARPIAGTRKKTGDAARDAVMRSELQLDEKEQAEHRMLLDLARNDLGRVAEYGSVAVSEREVIEEYSHVFHLVSEVVARLRPDCSAADVVRAVFPGGTITGAPKIRAMEVIAELEPVARGAYTGGLGWVGAGELQMNILIRSAVIRDGTACLQAGAGIVWDADPTREWRESLRKGAAMRVALGAEQPSAVGEAS